MSFYIILALALAPSVAISTYIYWRDKFDREPLRVMWWSFFWGCISVLPVLLFEILADDWIKGVGDGNIKVLITAFLGVALIEEGFKLIFLRAYSYKSPYFDEPYDGITYAVMVSMGFATIENLLYVFTSDIPLQVALLRMFTAVPAHATFAILMGYFVGLGKFKGRAGWFYSLLGLLSATFFHGAYDYFLMQDIDPGLAIGAFVSLIVAAYLSLKAIKLHQKNSPFNPVSPTIESPVDRGDDSTDRYLK